MAVGVVGERGGLEWEPMAEVELKATTGHPQRRTGV